MTLLIKMVIFCCWFGSETTPYHVWRHLLKFADKVCKELRHVLLFSCVQWLLVHGVRLTETAGIVRLSLTFL